MMRIFLLSFFILSTLLGAGTTVQAAGIPLLDSNFSLVPDANELDPSCAPGAPLSFGAVMEIAQRFVNVGISLGIFFFVIILAWAGFLFMISATNPESRSQAKKMLLNAAIGLLIILSAWLMVDFIMKALYSGPDGTAGKFGPWNSILGDGPACVVATTSNSLFSGAITAAELEAIESWEVNPSTGSGGSHCPAADASGMVPFSASVTQGDTEKGSAETVRNFLAMRTEALKEGVDLKVVDGYRPDSEQLALWNRFCSSGTCGRVKVAKPCSLGGSGSNHNTGQALDLTVGCRNGDGNCNTKAYRWLKANGSRWNFKNAVPTDPVHWSPTGR